MLKQEFEDYKPTVNAIKVDLEQTKGDLNKVKTDLDNGLQDLATVKEDLKLTKAVIPPPGTILGWVSKLHPDDEAAVELPEG